MSHIRRPTFSESTHHRRNNKSRDVSLLSGHLKRHKLNSRAIKAALATLSHFRSDFLLTLFTENGTKQQRKSYNIIKCFHAKQMIHHSTVLVSQLLLAPKPAKFVTEDGAKRKQKIEIDRHPRRVVCCFRHRSKSLRSPHQHKQRPRVNRLAVI